MEHGGLLTLHLGAVHGDVLPNNLGIGRRDTKRPQIRLRHEAAPFKSVESGLKFDGAHLQEFGDAGVIDRQMGKIVASTGIRARGRGKAEHERKKRCA